jgi:hypothetical protein
MSKKQVGKEENPGWSTAAAWKIRELEIRVSLGALVRAYLRAEGGPGIELGIFEIGRTRTRSSRAMNEPLSAQRPMVSAIATVP